MNFMTSRLTEITTCSICRETYTEPKILNCYHTFCTKCLQGVFDQSTFDSAPCPICRRHFSPPERQAKNLPSCPFMQDVLEIVNGENTFHGNNEQCTVCDDKELEAVTVCMDCNTFMCEKCTNVHKKFKTDSHTVLKLDEVKDTSIMAVLAAKRRSRTCIMHPPKHLEFFCLNCNVLVCDVCNDTDHGSHITQSVHSCTEDTRNMIRDASLQFKPEVENLERIIEGLRYLIAGVQSDKESTVTDIQALASQLVQVIRHKEQHLVQEVEINATANHKLLRDALENAEMQLSMRQSLLQYMDALTAFGNDEQLAQEKRTLEQRSAQLHQQEIVNLPDGKNFKMKFESSEEVQHILKYQTIGSIVDHQSTKVEALSRNTTSSECLNSAELSSLPVGFDSYRDHQFTNVRNTSRDVNDEYLSPYHNDGNENTNPKVSMAINNENKETEQKQVVVAGNTIAKCVLQSDETVVKWVQGKDTFHRRNMAGKDANGHDSHRAVLDNRIYEEITDPGNIHQPKTSGGTGNPPKTPPRGGDDIPRETISFRTHVKISGMDITNKNEIIVVSNSSKKCLVFSNDGSLRNEITEQIGSPWDVAASRCQPGEGEILFVTDTGRKTGEGTVKSYGINGDFIKTVVSKLKKPYGITVSKCGNIFVCDAGDRCVVMINSAKKKVKKIKEDINGWICFFCPWYISMNPAGNIVVSDFEEGFIKVYDTKKKQTTSYRPRYRNCAAGLPEFRPAMSCTDTNNNLFVVDQATNYIHVLTAEQKSMKIPIPSELGLSKPITVTLDSDQRLWIGTRRGDVVKIPYNITEMK